MNLAAIERLQASRKKSIEDLSAAGRTEGRYWAEHRAEYDDLVAMSNFELTGCYGQLGLLGALKLELDPDGDTDEFMAHLFGRSRPEPSGVFIEAFIEGAQEYFSEVRDAVEA